MLLTHSKLAAPSGPNLKLIWNKRVLKILGRAGHIDSWLSEGTRWSAYGVIHFFLFSETKDQLPGH